MICTNIFTIPTKLLIIYNIIFSTATSNNQNLALQKTDPLLLNIFILFLHFYAGTGEYLYLWLYTHKTKLLSNRYEIIVSLRKVQNNKPSTLKIK